MSVLVTSCIQNRESQSPPKKISNENEPLTFRIVTLGCKVNQAESEQIVEDLQGIGYIFVRENQQADISIINTCTVTSKADRRSLSAVRYSAKNSPYIFVTGCYSDLQKDLLQKEMGITSIIPNTDKRNAAKHIHSILFEKSTPFLTSAVETRKSLFYKIPEEQLLFQQSQYFTHTRSFIKIQDGCSNFCSFCRIPFARGTPVSRSPEDIFNQLQMLQKGNIPELVITGINIGEYEYGEFDFAKILGEIANRVNPIFVRVSSIEPHSITKSVLESLSLPNIIPHIHLSVQSGSDYILSKMRRKYTTADFLKIVQQLRKINSNFSITTDVIAGFPGESEELFFESTNFLKKCDFTKMHVFPFSSRPLTRAFHYPDTVSPSEKKIRVKILSKISQESYKRYHKKLLYEDQRFLAEEILPPNSTRISKLVPPNLQNLQYKFYQIITEYYIRGILLSCEELPLGKSLYKKLSEENFFLYENF